MPLSPAVTAVTESQRANMTAWPTCQRDRVADVTRPVGQANDQAGRAGESSSYEYGHHLHLFGDFTPALARDVQLLRPLLGILAH